MKILIAPDKFKGSLNSPEVAQAIERGIKKVVPSVETIICPIADGGEGTVEALVTALGGDFVFRQVSDPLGEKIIANFGLLGEPTADGHRQRAVIEMAAASGLRLIPESRRNPMVTTTYGTGELIAAALEYQPEEIIIGVGGSATCDAGMGMAQALGVGFYDADGNTLGVGGRELARLTWIDISQLDPRVAQTKFLVACDVDNPLSGPNGAARVYAPQKGATPEMVEELDKGLANFAYIVKRDLHKDINDVPGAGAAGGLGAGLITFLNAELKSGIGLIISILELDKKLEGVDLVITGEGKVDVQTARGKAPIGIARLAQRKGIPVFVIAGQSELDLQVLAQAGIVKIATLTEQGVSPDEAIKQASPLLEAVAEKVFRELVEKGAG
jgi:glycerate kinase